MIKSIPFYNDNDLNESILNTNPKNESQQDDQKKTLTTRRKEMYEKQFEEDYDPVEELD